MQTSWKTYSLLTHFWLNCMRNGVNISRQSSIMWNLWGLWHLNQITRPHESCGSADQLAWCNTAKSTIIITFFKYLIATENYGLLYSCDVYIKLTGDIDSLFVRETTTRWSSTGSTFRIGTRIIVCSSQRQKSVSFRYLKSFIV